MNIGIILGLFYSLLRIPQKARRLNQYPGESGVMIYKGNGVRLVEMRGCQATERCNPQEGVVVGFEEIENPGATTSPSIFRKNLIALIKLDTCEITKRPAMPREWDMHDGLPEHCR